MSVLVISSVSILLVVLSSIYAGKQLLKNKEDADKGDL